jgi:hypothetical protein
MLPLQTAAAQHPCSFEIQEFTDIPPPSPPKPFCCGKYFGGSWEREPSFADTQFIRKKESSREGHPGFQRKVLYFILCRRNKTEGDGSYRHHGSWHFEEEMHSVY